MNKLLKNREEEFSEDFKCIQHGCDNNGSISVMGSDGEQEQEQCQYCDEYKFKQKNFNKQTTILIFKELIQKMEGDKVEIPEVSTFDQFHDDNERRINNQALQQQIDFLQGLITTLEI